MDLKKYIREVSDFPSPGISFKDITPLLKNPEAFQYILDKFSEFCLGVGVDVVVGIEARGFLFAAPLALQLQRSFIPIRKEGKLPGHTNSISYALEYGVSTVEIHADAIASGQRVFIVDDLLATGGTMDASAKLIQRNGGYVVGYGVVIELVSLCGRDRLKEYDVLSLVRY